jgi:hypothetical protein
MARLGLAQESYVQNPTPKPSQTHPFSNAALDEAFARAVARLAGIAPPSPTGRASPVDDAPADIPIVEHQISGAAEVLRVLREPIECLLSLAHRIAINDPVDLAAVQRVNAALIARWSGQPGRLRARDVLIVLGLLFSVLDPAAAIRAVSNTLSHGLAAVLGSAQPLSFYVVGIPDPAERRESQLGRSPHACCHLHAHRTP